MLKDSGGFYLLFGFFSSCLGRIMEIWQSHSGSSVGGRVFVALMICEFD